MVASDIRLDRLRAIMRRRWRVLLYALLFGLAAGQVLLMVIRPQFTAVTQVLLDPRKPGVTEAKSVMQGLPLDTSAVESEVALLKSLTVALRVAEKLVLKDDPDFGRAEPPGFISLIMQRIWPAAETNPTPDGNFDPGTLRAANAIRAGMAVRRIGVTYAIEISFTAPRPDVASAIANGLADAYLNELLESRFEASRRASEWLGTRLAGMRGALELSERAVAEYRKDQGLFETNAGGLEKQQLSELTAQLVIARALTSEKKARFEQSQKLGERGGSVAGVAEVLQSSVVSNLRTQEAEVARKEADLSSQFGPRHPNVQTVRAQLQDIRGAINNEVQRIVSNLKNELEVARKREASLEDSLERQSGATSRSDQASIRLRDLLRDADTNKQLYESFLQRFKETREQTTLELRESRVISTALKPRAASYPRRSVTMLASTVLSLLIGIGAIVLLEAIESGFATPEDLEATLGKPVLSTIPMIPASELLVNKEVLTVPQLVVAKPTSRTGEAIRGIRVGISLSNVDNPPRVVLFTSSVPAEGKSTVVSSVAWSAAAVGQRVLLIDCDLRHPSTSKLHGLETAKGIVDVLAGTVELRHTLVSFFNGNLSVLAAGSPTKSPPDVLGSQRMRALIETVRNEFDLVLIDAPPIAPVMDAQVIASMVDKAVFVIEWDKTPREIVGRAVKILDGTTNVVAGFVLNKTNMKKLSRYSQYYSYGYERYNKYYNE
jgi:polysaccharide biosynthesis transport protein